MDPFVNDQVAIASIPTVEDLQYEKLDSKSRKLSILMNSIFCLVLGIIYVIIGIFLPILFSFPYYILAIAFLTLLLGFSIWYSYRSYENKGFSVRQKDIIYKSGVWWKSMIIIPFNRVQHCEIIQGPIDRYLSLSDIILYTAGGSSSDLQISGINQDVAANVKLFVTGQIVQDEEE